MNMLARNSFERKKISQLVSVMLESTFYLEMKLTERLQLIKMLADSSF